MCKPVVQTIVLTTLIVLVSACGPAATPEPARATSAPVSPTAVPVPPTSVAALPTGADTPASAVISVDTAGQVERLQTLSGHSGAVTALAFSGDGAYVASSGVGEAIKLWDVKSGQEVHVFQESTGQAIRNGIAFSPDGRLLACAETIWDVASKQVVHTLKRGRHSPVAFSPDGSTLAVAPGEQPIELWDVASGQMVRTLDAQGDNLARGIVFSPDGTRVATAGNGGAGGVARLWDVATGHIVGTLEHGSTGGLHDVAFSPDGSMLASSSPDSTIRLWDLASGQVVRTMRHGGGLYSAAFSPAARGRLLASAGDNGTIILWDVASGRQVRSLRHGGEVMEVAFAPDGTLLASCGYSNPVVYLWGVPR